MIFTPTPFAGARIVGLEQMSEFYEPAAGRGMRGLSPPGVEMALLWVLNLSDGRHTMLGVAEQARMPFSLVRRAAGAPVVHGLLGPAT